MTSIGMTEASFCMGMREVTILLSEIKHKTMIPIPTIAHCTTNPPSQQWKRCHKEDSFGVLGNGLSWSIRWLHKSSLLGKIFVLF